MPSNAIACVVSSIDLFTKTTDNYSSIKSNAIDNCLHEYYLNSKNAKFLSKLIWHANTGLPAACANPDKCICWLKYSIISSSVTPNGILPTYNLSIEKNNLRLCVFYLNCKIQIKFNIKIKNWIYRLACLVIVEPTTGTAACGVSATMLAGIWPAACIALYWSGVICSKPGGGTSQYKDGLRRRERPLPPRLAERERLRRRSLDLLRPPRPRLRDRSRERFRRVFPRSPTPPRNSRSTKY